MTGEGEGIAQVPNRRRKISDMTAKEKEVGIRKQDESERQGRHRGARSGGYVC
jgi:hypothetical protein